MDNDNTNPSHDEDELVLDNEWIFDDEANAKAVLYEKLADAEIPGFQAEFNPEEAALAGAFVEDALSEKDAIESAIDLIDLMAPEHILKIMSKVED